MNADRYIRLPDRAVFAISGEDARDFLQGLITNDIDLLAPDRAIYAALLTPQGKFLHDFFLVDTGKTLLLDCLADGAADLFKRLRMYRLRAKVDITEVSTDWAVLALLPGDTNTGTAGSAESWKGGIVFADPRHAGLGARAILPAETDLADLNLTEAILADYEQQRLSLGVPGQMDLIFEKSMPLENGFDELNGVSFTKGCFVGQEVTTRMKHRNLVKKRLFPVTLDDTVAPGTPVKCGDVAAGEIHSVHDRTALALLRLDLAEKGGLTAADVAIHPSKPDWANF